MTLVDMLVAIVAGSILLLGLTAILAQNQTAYNRTQNHLFGDVVTDGYAVQRVFDRVVRKSTQTYCQVATNSLAVFYYSDPNAALPDRYASFTWSGTAGDDVTLTTGELSSPGAYDSWGTGNTQVIARNVADCRFIQYGAALRMYLTLDDGEYEMSLTASARRFN
jgi:hypothetical protein